MIISLKNGDCLYRSLCLIWEGLISVYRVKRQNEGVNGADFQVFLIPSWQLLSVTARMTEDAVQPDIHRG